VEETNRRCVSSKSDMWRVTKCNTPGVFTSLVTRHPPPFWPASIKVMQPRMLSGQNRARYPGGPPHICGEDGG